MAAQPFFLPADSPLGAGQRFCVYHPAETTPAKALIVHVHPFAEEMNKSRRMAALQSRAFARAGCSVLHIDLTGCGDSSGDFADASWQAWTSDIVAACRWLRATADAPLWLWGLRAGCLLAAKAAARIDGSCNLLFWQAPVSGKLLVQQFLRLRLAAEMSATRVGAGAGVVEGLRNALASGDSVEVAGYLLGADLANGLEAATLDPPVGAGRMEWIEISSREEAALLPASPRAIGRWQEAGWSVRSQVAHGPAFWQTVEIEEAPALIDASLAALDLVPEVAPA